jgi:hypothetical protein
MPPPASLSCCASAAPAAPSISAATSADIDITILPLTIFIMHSTTSLNYLGRDARNADRAKRMTSRRELRSSANQVRVNCE